MVGWFIFYCGNETNYFSNLLLFKFPHLFRTLSWSFCILLFEIIEVRKEIKYEDKKGRREIMLKYFVGGKRIQNYKTLTRSTFWDIWQVLKIAATRARRPRCLQSIPVSRGNGELAKVTKCQEQMRSEGRK